VISCLSCATTDAEVSFFPVFLSFFEFLTRNYSCMKREMFVSDFFRELSIVCVSKILSAIFYPLLLNSILPSPD
jgi:hypothetical protein